MSLSSRFLFFMYLTLALSKKSYDGYKVYRCVPTDQKQVDFLLKIGQKPGFDIWSHGAKIGREIDIMVHPDEQPNFERLLASHNISTTVLIEDVGEQIHEENNNQRRGLFSRSVSGKADFNRFMRYQEILNYVTYLAEEYPEICELEHIGQSFEGRPLVMLKISDGVGRKPIYLMEAGMHAREWAGPATVTYLISQLVENSTRSKDFLNKADYYIIPVANPDGYEFSHTNDRFWRKTRSKHEPCDGVDGNRNFGYHWAEGGSSTDLCDETYHGPFAFSELETQVLRDVGYKYHDRIFAYSAIHSYGGYLLYPWGYTKDMPDNWQQLESCAQIAVTNMEKTGGTKYAQGTSSRLLYVAAGGSDDWFLGVLGTPYAYTFELPATEEEGFNLNPSKIKSVASEAIEGIKTIAGCAYDYYKENHAGNKLRNSENNGDKPRKRKVRRMHRDRDRSHHKRHHRLADEKST